MELKAPDAAVPQSVRCTIPLNKTPVILSAAKDLAGFFAAQI